MGFSIVGGALNNLAEVEASSLALRVTERAIDPLTLGEYLMCIDNGTTVMTAGLAANSPIVAFRWGNANLCKLNSIKFQFAAQLPFAAGNMRFECFYQRNWTGNFTGGTAATLTGNNGKKRTSFGTTLLTEFRYSTTATLTTGGTPTVDAQPFGVYNYATIVTNPNPGQMNGDFLYKRDTADVYPIVFAQNEGFVIQASVPATGTWVFNCAVDWLETAAY